MFFKSMVNKVRLIYGFMHLFPNFEHWGTKAEAFVRQ